MDGDAPRDIRPQVASLRPPLPAWVLVAAAIGAGAILFLLLDARRQALNAPAVGAQPAEPTAVSPPPALRIPPEIRPAPAATIAPPPAPPEAPALPRPQPPAPQTVYVPQPAPAAPAPAPRVQADSGAILVIDNGAPARAEAARAAPAAEAREGRAAPPADTSRARAGAFANRGTTILQGTLIPAVLESALDSTRPGFARAIVSRDVRGFDGSRVLIPRGSRLIGEYGSDAAPGQKRALITWTRLVRPDGATIAIGSPAADTLGRTGVRARVDTHFFERFSGAILQSALDIGVNLAARSVDSPTVIALPGSLGGVTAQAIQPQQVTPTLTVKRGTSVSVFVARDLDFTGVEGAR